MAEVGGASSLSLSLATSSVVAVGETLREHQGVPSDGMEVAVDQQAEYRMELRNYQHVALSRARARNVVMVGTTGVGEFEG